MSTRKGRKNIQLRPLKIIPGPNRFAEGSALIQMGNTHVLCTASIEEGVPGWMKGQGRGWITAEYSMLPRATHTRSKRDREKVSGRTQEIQRLIGRALRSIVDLNLLGERTIYIDCDVLQADGGTRTASISGGCVALGLAVKRLLKQKKLSANPLTGSVAAVSVGISESGTVLLDLDYPEDSQCAVDMNVVATGEGALVEIQGTAEKQSFTQKQLSTMLSAALKGIKEIQKKQKQVLSSSKN